MARYDHVIFDVDGVLADSLEIACEEINRLREEDFPSIPQVSNQEDLAYLYCGPLSSSLRRFGLSDEEAKRFFDAHSEAMQRRYCSVSCFTGVLEAIASTVSGRCSIVTSCYAHAVRLLVTRSLGGASTPFGAILGREVCLPKPRKILKVLAEVGVSHQTAVYVGDMVSDILYCRSVPVDVAVVGYGYHPVSYLQAFAPDYCLSTPADLCEFLASMMGTVTPAAAHEN